MVNEIPLSPINRILRTAGAQRVSNEAILTLRDFVEKIALEVAKESIEACKHANRVTVKKEDITYAIKTVLKYYAAKVMVEE